MAMPKGGFESSAGARGEWRIAQGNKQQCAIIVMGTMLVTHMTKISYDNYSRNVAQKKLTFLFITTVYLVLFRIEAP